MRTDGGLRAVQRMNEATTLDMEREYAMGQECWEVAWERSRAGRHTVVIGPDTLPADVTEALIYTKLLPGSTGPQVVAYLGYKLGGWSGSAVATAAFVFPAALMMLVLAAAYAAVTTLPALQPAMH